MSVAGTFGASRTNHAENRIEIASWEVPQWLGVASLGLAN
jgi:hypothetical protein